MTPDEQVVTIRARRPGFGGGPGRGGRDGVGAGWYDAAVYPADTYPALPPEVFARLAGGTHVGPGWRGYPTQAEADADAVRAQGGVFVTPDEQAFLRAILSNPADDTVRLVYADWLGEHDQPERAEFIRLQVELDSYRSVIDAVAPELVYTPQIRERELLTAHREDWFPLWDVLWRGLEADWNGLSEPAVFRRGFVSELTCTAEDWLTHADQLFWSPEQTVECPECEGSTLVYLRGKDGRRLGRGVSTWSGPTRGGWPVVDCPRCQNEEGIPTGRVPRPFVPAAHPVTRVTLTTVPEIHEFGTRHKSDGPNEYLYSLDDTAPDDSSPHVIWLERHAGGHVIAAALLSRRWPGVEFTLPPPA